MSVEQPDTRREQSSRRAYDAWHECLEADVETDTPWHRLLFGHLDPLRDLSSKRVLEIACGRGGLACRLARASHPPPTTLIGADSSTTAVTKARALATTLGIDTVQWIVSDMHALAHPTAAFDTVICCETIEHLTRPQDALAEVARVLTPGGRLLLTTPNYLGPLGLYRGYVRLRGRPFTEMGQPINRLTLLPRTLSWLRAGRPASNDGGRHWSLPSMARAAPGRDRQPGVAPLALVRLALAGGSPEALRVLAHYLCWMIGVAGPETQTTGAERAVPRSARVGSAATR